MDLYERIKFRIVILWIGLGLCVLNSGFAQNNMDKKRLNRSVEVLDSTILLKEALVIGKSFNKVIPVQSLTSKQLEGLSSHTVADALRYFAGVQVKDYGGLGGLKTIDVRNMGTHHVGVFYDGIELGNAQNGVIDLGKYSLDDMESLTIYNGQKSEIFQSAKDFASASTVYLQTKKPVFTEDKKNNLLIRFKTMSINYLNPSFRLEHKFSKNTNMCFSGEYTKSDGRYKFTYKRKNLDGSIAYDTTAIRHNSDIESLRSEVGLFGNITDGSWHIKAYYYQSDRGAPGAIVANKFSDGYRQNDRNIFLQSNFIKNLGEKYHFQLKAKYAFDYTNYLARDTTSVLGEIVTESAQFDNTFQQQEIYISTVHMYNITAWWDVSLSTDFQWNVLNANLKGIAVPFAYPKRYSTLASLASSLSFGRLKIMGSAIGTYVHETVEYGAVSPDKKEVCPAIFMGYQVFKNSDLTLRAFAKRVFRMPSFNDLYYTQIGSSILLPEYMNQLNAGFSYSKLLKNKIITRISLETDIYYTHTKDKIIAAPTGNLFRWMMNNIGKVEGKGLESIAGISSSINKLTLNLNLTYAYSESKDFTKIFGLPLSSYGDQIPYTPWHSGSGILNLGYKNFNINYSFIYVGKRYNGAFNNVMKNKVQPWYTHDFSIQKEWKNRYFRTNTTVEINNLLNQHYEVIYNYPMPGRVFRFIISVLL